jgi:hypothetical protein
MDFEAQAQLGKENPGTTPDPQRVWDLEKKSQAEK